MRNHSIDILKFICALLVVFLHVSTPYSSYYMPLTRCAVPIFLIISGYLVYNDMDLLPRLKKNIKRIAWIGLWATLLFIPIKIFISRGVGFLGFKSIFNWIVLNDNPFGFHLWYLHAYLYAMVIIYVFYKIDKLKWLYISVPLLLVTDLVFGKYSLCIWGREFPFIYVRNFICVGIPYVLIGFLIKKYENKLMIINNIYYLLGGVICLVSSICEYQLLDRIGLNATRDHYISTTFLAICVVLMTLSYKSHKENFVASLGRRDSLYIYIFHAIILMFIPIVNRKLLPDVWARQMYPYLAPFIVIILTLVLIVSLRKLKIIKIR